MLLTEHKQLTVLQGCYPRIWADQLRLACRYGRGESFPWCGGSVRWAGRR
jgi:hypothetical protein